MTVRTYTDVTDLASAARTTNQAVGPFYATSEEGLDVILDLTAFVTAASLTLVIDEWVNSKGGYIPALTSTVLAANGQIRLRIDPYSPDVTNQRLCEVAPRRFQIRVTHGNANSHTYTLEHRLWSVH